MLEMMVGMSRGLVRLAPFTWRITELSSMMPIPPIPDPKQQAKRSAFSASMSMPACFMASSAAMMANCTKQL